MGMATMDWAPTYFGEDPEYWEEAPRKEWKFVIWTGRGGRLLRGFGKGTKLPQAVEEQLQGYKYQPVIREWTKDLAQKNEVQAIAEVLEGDAYIAIPSTQNPNNDVNGWDTTSAWGGWEFPALALNDNFGTLYRLDPTKKEKPVKIWQKGDPKPDQRPKGNRQDITFSGDYGDFFKGKSKTFLPLQQKLKSLMGR
ncbi:hypothetical protein NUU61_008497 [Penicillium alfredii]|uniref:Uncharacterized protein n=1 Tax=Penicillium alfredii TaxID=1506179 RepID=A0A9W9ELA5_9EURO|nr:uncharacterized protein NUU61_008497 [Penicillium alfredii]KAJ5083918.1 hypothetical protein NUU61_008497 [Penicillium alfredii]